MRLVSESGLLGEISIFFLVLSKKVLRVFAWVKYAYYKFFSYIGYLEFLYEQYD